MYKSPLEPIDPGIAGGVLTLLQKGLKIHDLGFGCFLSVKNAVLVLSANSSHLWDNIVRQRWSDTVLKIAAAAIGRAGAEWSALCVSHGSTNPIPPAHQPSRNRRGLSANTGDGSCASPRCAAAVAVLPSCRMTRKKINGESL